MISSGLAAQQTATPLVFKDVTVIDVTDGQLVPNQAVVIAGNRIEAAGAVGDLAIRRRAVKRTSTCHVLLRRGS